MRQPHIVLRADSQVSYDLFVIVNKKFSCDKCEYTCKRLDILAKHRFANHKVGSQGYDVIHCMIGGCSYQAVFKDKMARHKLAKHEVESEGYQTLLCPQAGCNYKSTDPGYLQVHIEGVHEKLRPNYGSYGSKVRHGRMYKCGVCGDRTYNGYVFTEGCKCKAATCNVTNVIENLSYLFQFCVTVFTI